MARNRRRRPLYEVIGAGRLKNSYDRRLREQPAEGQARSQEPKPPISGFVWPQRPRLVQFNLGRVEFSLPYQLALAVFLGMLVLLLLAFRIGRWQTKQQKGLDKSAESTQLERKSATGDSALSVQPEEQTEAQQRIVAGPPEPGPKGKKISMVEPIRDNRIVIQQHQTRADLIPVQKYFAGHSVETLIEHDGNWWFLVTKDFYQNPERKETDGYKAKQQIIRLGVSYKAPEGYETFAPHFFSDAYGKKVR